MADHWLIRLLDIAVWPVTVMVALCLLRKDIVRLIARLISMKLPGGAELVFGELKGDKTDVTQSKTTLSEQPSADPPPKIPNKPGNLYWLGYDLMWTFDAIARNAPHRTILHGLRQALHHADELGLSHDERVKSLRELKARVAGMRVEDVELSRRTLAEQVRQIANGLGHSIEMAQSDFRGFPEPHELERKMGQP